MVSCHAVPPFRKFDTHVKQSSTKKRLFVAAILQDLCVKKRDSKAPKGLWWLVELSKQSVPLVSPNALWTTEMLHANQPPLTRANTVIVPVVRSTDGLSCTSQILHLGDLGINKNNKYVWEGMCPFFFMQSQNLWLARIHKVQGEVTVADLGSDLCIL